MKVGLAAFGAAVAMVAGLSGTAGLAADAVVYVPPPAPPPVEPAPGLVVSGSGDAWVGWRWVESTQDPNGEDLTAGGNAYLSIPFGEKFSTQFDAQYEHYFDDDTFSPLGALLLGGHVSVRNPDRFLIGAFGAAALPFGDQIDNDSEGFYSGWGYVVGGEAQAYIDNLTLYVQGGFGDIKTDFDDGPEGFVAGWFVRGVARYFFTDDFMIQGEYSYGATNCYIDGFCSPTEDAGQFHNWGALAKLRLFDSLPIYGTLGYQGGNYHADEDPDTGVEHSVRIGFSVLFGADTLLHNDRYGATLSLPMLPVRAAAWAEALD